MSSTRALNILLFGATGMVGQGVLRECLLDPGVEQVVSIGRSTTGRSDPKLREVILKDLMQIGSIEAELRGFDACFFCLGVSSAGMREADYRRLTYDLTVTIAQVLARLNPQMVFTYVSGAGTDSSEKGRSMWARVKGQTENALLKLPFKAAVMFRPGPIVPMHGVRSKTAVYRAIYAVTQPFWGPLLRHFPQSVTSSEQVGKAMLRVAHEGGAVKPILDPIDINAL